MFSKNIPIETSIKVSYFDTDGKKVGGLTVKEANKIHELDPSRLFYFQNGDGTEEELTILEVNKLLPDIDLLPQAPACPTNPQVCGPPLVKFFGGGAGFGAAANAVISPISSGVIGFDIVNAGKGFEFAPNAELIDNCGKGSGGSLVVNMEDDDTTGIGTTVGTGTTAGVGKALILQENKLGATEVGRPGVTNDLRDRNINKTKKIKNITIKAPGDGYLASPDGSLGGNERVWKEADEGYIKTGDNQYYVVQPYRPIPVKKGSTYYSPDGKVRLIEEDEVITLPLLPIKPTDPTSYGTPYPVILCIEEIVVLDQGFGYRPGDELVITPNNGTETELIINEFGGITGIKVLKGGCGFNDFPELKTNSTTGFNATFTPIFKVTQIDTTKPIETQISPVGPKVTATEQGQYVIPDQVELVTVIDCVGKFTPKRTFNVPR